MKVGAYLDSYNKGLEVLDKIRAEVEQNSHSIVSGMNKIEQGMTLYEILQVIDKYKEGSEDRGMTREEALYRVKGYLTDIIPIEHYSEVEEIIKALEQESILNKIRTEIKALTDGAEPEHIWNVDVLAIIDKYKAESEGSTIEELEQFGIDKFIAENIAEKLGELQRQFESL